MQTPREASSLGSPRVGYVVVSEGHAVRAGYRCKVSCSHVTEATKPKLRTGTASSSEHVSGNSVHDSYPRELPWDGSAWLSSRVMALPVRAYSDQCAPASIDRRDGVIISTVIIWTNSEESCFCEECCSGATTAGQSLRDPALPAAVVQGSGAARSAVRTFSGLIGGIVTWL